jgi:glycosyltransferase involved in cell wall biosynthesis
MLLLCKTVDEVIVINDGSTDRSLEILKGFGRKIKLINSRENKGKGWAMAQGIKRAKGKIVSFWDADTINLEDKYIEQLIKPMTRPGVDGVIGQEYITKHIPRKPESISGERAYFKHDLLSHLKQMETSRFGVEVLLNKLYKQKNVKVVKLVGLNALTKHKKHGTNIAMREYYEEGMEIIKQLVKQTKLSPEDKKIFKDLKKITKLEEIEKRVKRIKNKELKEFILKNLIGYLRKARAWLREEI